MAYDDPETLVSTGWLFSHLDDPNLRILDASWYVAEFGRDPRAEYDAAHIPGARFVALDDVSDGRSDLPHMAPAPEKFVSRIRAQGVGDGHQVVIYDGAGLFSAARMWWLFRLMGKANVAILDGGLPKWQAEGRPVNALFPKIRDRHLTVAPQNHLVRDVTAVAAASKLGTPQIVDARAAARFRGETPEARAGLRAGHMPGAVSLPYGTLLAQDRTMKDADALRAAFAAAGVDLSQPIITTCGSGVTAAIVSLALEVLGHRDHGLYDGSWAEWGMYNDLRVATGE